LEPYGTTIYWRGDRPTKAVITLRPGISEKTARRLAQEAARQLKRTYASPAHRPRHTDRERQALRQLFDVAHRERRFDAGKQTQTLGQIERDLVEQGITISRTRIFDEFRAFQQERGLSATHYKKHYNTRSREVGKENT
jgi:hypothetical protein